MKKNILIKTILCVICLLFLVSCRQNPSADATTWQEQYDLGVRYLSEGNYEEAIIAFSAAIEIDPKRAEAYVGRGDAYVLSGETGENLTAAQVDYEKAIELKEALPEAYLGLADIYIRRGDYAKAMEILKLGLEKTSGAQLIADKIAEIESGNISDSSGNERRTSAYGPDGSLIWHHDYTYNDQGKKNSITAYDRNENQIGHIDLTYTISGHKLVAYWYGPDDGEIGKVEYEYDESGKQSGETWYHPDGEFMSRYKNTYNGDLVSKKTEYNESGEIVRYETIQYNENGDRTQCAFYSADSELIEYQTWEYENGKTSVYSSFSGDGTLEWRQVSRYDDDGKYIGCDEYDGEGNLTRSMLNQS